MALTEKLFTPSVWTKRMDPELVVQHFVEETKAATKWAREAVPCELANHYGPGSRHTVDVYGTDLPEDSPIFVYIPGGRIRYLHVSNTI